MQLSVYDCEYEFITSNNQQYLAKLKEHMQAIHITYQLQWVIISQFQFIIGIKGQWEVLELNTGWWNVNKHKKSRFVFDNLFAGCNIMTVRGVTQCVCGLGCSRNFQYQLRNECLVQLIGNVSGNVFFNPSYSAHKNKLLLFVLYVEPKLIELVDSPHEKSTFC